MLFCVSAAEITALRAAGGRGGGFLLRHTLILVGSYLRTIKYRQKVFSKTMLIFRKNEYNNNFYKVFFSFIFLTQI